MHRLAPRWRAPRLTRVPAAALTGVAALLALTPSAQAAATTTRTTVATTAATTTTTSQTGTPARALAAAPTPMLGHWAYTWPEIRYIKFANYANTSQFPVTAQANVWNSYLSVNSVPIRFQIVDSCGSQKPCFNVTQSTACVPNTKSLGGVTSLNITTGLITAVTNITLYNCGSDVTSASANVRSVVAGHELGHALGLNHDPASLDLMHSAVGDSSKNTPSVSNMLSLIEAYR